MQRYAGVLLTLVILLGGIAVLSDTDFRLPGMYQEPIVPAIIVSSPFIYTFNSPGTLFEAGEIDRSTSPYWWVNSGGKLILADDVGATIQGSLPETDPWYRRYAASSKADTDSGAHPQNLFRLVSRSLWEDVRQEVDFYIAKDNLSASPNRNASNGVLLMARYSDDGQSLYYAGLRVDGTAVIKKKYKGIYYTMTQSVIFAGTYERNSKKDIIPHEKWIRLRLDTVTNADGSVSLTLYMQNPTGKTWKRIASAKDSGTLKGTPPITGARYIGIRTDFMDVKFDNFLAQTL